MIWSMNFVMLLTALAALQIDTVIGTSRSKRFNSVTTEVDKLIEKKINDFSFELFKKIENKKNLVVSPLSVWTTLVMATIGSKGATQSDIMGGLHLEYKSIRDDLRKIRELIQRLNPTQTNPSTRDENQQLVSEVGLQLVNKIFVKKGLEVKGTPRNLLHYIHNSLPSNLDFTKSEEASQAINNWFLKQTYGRMTNIVDPNMIDRNAAMIFINTLYFNGDWVNQFSPYDTVPRDFHLEDGTSVQIPMMSTRGSFKCGEVRNQNISFIELPYRTKLGNDAVSMFIIIPDKISDLKSAEENLRNLWLNHLKKAIILPHVDVYLPKFKIESFINLQSPLKKLKMGSLFKNDADFSGFAQEPMNVSSIIQKVVIEVNEAGTEKKTVNKSLIYIRPTTKEVKVNKPFLFLIATKDLILFSGKISDPRQEISTVGHIQTAKKTTTDKKELGQSIAEKVNDFSFELVKEIENKKNLVVSPLSVWTTLSMALIGSNGTTRSELRAGLHLDSLEKDARGIYLFLKKLNTTQMISSTSDENQQLVPRVELRLANKIFVKKGLEVKKNSKTILHRLYDSLPTSLDFTKSKEASDTINDWVRQQTNGQIKNFVDPSMIDSNAAMILINTLYFNGRWLNQFTEESTEPRDFYLEDKSKVQVPTMLYEGEFGYGKNENEHIEFINLPYKNKVGNDTVSMFVIIPDETSDLKSTEGNLRNLWLNILRKSNNTKEGTIFLPKFKIESTINLQSPLEKLKMRNLFNAEADFSEFAEEPMSVSSITQKVIIDVNERGTEAVAATRMDVSTRIGGFTFYANRPFLFLICTEEVILFSGRIVDPRQ